MMMMMMMIIIIIIIIVTTYIVPFTYDAIDKKNNGALKQVTKELL